MESYVDFQLPANFQLPAGVINPAPVPLPPAPAPAPTFNYSGIGSLNLPMGGMGGERFEMPRFNLPAQPAPAPAPMPQMPAPSNIDLSQFNLPDLSNIDLSQFNLPAQQAPAPAPMPAPAPAPAPSFNPMGERGGENFAMPDLSNLGLSNIDLSQFNLPAQPAAVAPAPQPAAAQAPIAAASFSPSQQMGSNALEPRDGPTGIETMAEFVGQGDFLDIPLPDGSTLGATPAIEPSPSSYYEDTPNNNGLTSAQQAGLDAFYAQYPNGFDLNLGNIGSEGGYGNIPGFSVTYPNAGNNRDNAENNRGGFQNDFDQQYGEDFGSLIGFGPVGVEGGWSYDGNGNEINGGPAGGEEPAVDNTPNNNGLTPAQQAALDAFYEQYPNGIDLGIGNVGSEGGYGYTPGNIPVFTGNYNPGVAPVTPVAPVANLGGGDPDPDTGTYAPRVAAPVNVRAASNYALTGAVPVTPVNAGNPFARPETQQGIGSLGGG